MRRTKFIRIDRPIRIGGDVVAVGSVLEVETQFAQEMVFYKKATIVDPPAPAAEPVAEPAAEPAPIARRSKRAKE